jgi:hypothetical protein
MCLSVNFDANLRVFGLVLWPSILAMAGCYPHSRLTGPMLVGMENLVQLAARAGEVAQ